MGLAVFAYLLLAASGVWLFYKRRTKEARPQWIRPFHYSTGSVMVALVLLLLTIGLVGTIGHYGSLGHSPHLIAGVLVVGLVLLSAWSATQISPKRPWARSLHISTNIALFLGFVFVSATGWEVVQKYLYEQVN